MVDMDLSDEVVECSAWTDEVIIHPEGDVTNDSGYAMESNPSGSTIDAIVRPSRARMHKLITEGRADSGEYIMLVARQDTDAVSAGDQVTYDNVRYEAQAPENDPLDGFVAFELHEVVD